MSNVSHIRLISVTTEEEFGQNIATAVYQAEHYTPGREGTRFEADIKLKIQPGEVRATIDIGEAKTKTPDEAFDKVAEWLERAAEALRKRKPAALNLPLYTGQE